MNPGICYLYEYHAACAPRNTGFIRITRHYQTCILQIHAKNLSLPDNMPLDLYAFSVSEDGMVQSHIETLSNIHKDMAIRLSVPERMFPKECSLAELNGFLIKSPDPHASVFWAASDPFLPEDAFSRSALSDPLPSPDDPVPEDSPSEQNSPEISVSDLGPEEKKSDIRARKIKRSELTLLPRRFWPLSNNSFLLHGYHNYNHLLLLEDEGRLWLGIPGIYDPRESRAAELFGFPRFTRKGAETLNLEENECEKSENFGHWCRCVGSVTTTRQVDPTFASRRTEIR